MEGERASTGERESERVREQIRGERESTDQEREGGRERWKFTVNYYMKIIAPRNKWRGREKEIPKRNTIHTREGDYRQNNGTGE